MKHVRGILSMGRYDDPNSATSSFSILLGAAPHLDEKARPCSAETGSLACMTALTLLHSAQYAVFGTVTAGWDVLDKMEQARAHRGDPSLRRAPAAQIRAVSRHASLIHHLQTAGDAAAG